MKIEKTKKPIRTARRLRKKTTRVIKRALSSARAYPSPVYFQFAAVLGAALLTALTVFGNVQQSLTAQVDHAITLTRQIAAQADGIALENRMNSTRESIKRAAELLSQGVDPREIQVFGLVFAPDLLRQLQNSPKHEVSTFSAKEGRFEFYKLLAPEAGAGVKIWLRVPFFGYLGSTNRFINDLSVLATFLIYLGIFFFARFYWRTKNLEPGLQPQFVSPEPQYTNEATTLRFASIREKIDALKQLLIKSGSHVREVVRAAHTLATACLKSRDALIGVRGRVHTGLGEFRTASRALRGWETHFSNLELILKKSPNQMNASDILAAAQHVAWIRQHFEPMTRIEHKIEPWATDLDLAVQIYENVFDQTSTLNNEVRKTMEALIEESKILQAARGECADELEASNPPKVA